jgi:hypothetical protein
VNSTKFRFFYGPSECLRPVRFGCPLQCEVHPKESLLALSGLVHLEVVGLVGISGETGCVDTTLDWQARSAELKPCWMKWMWIVPVIEKAQQIKRIEP